MSVTNRRKARKLLSSGGKASGTVQKWMSENPEAFAFVEEWIKMRVVGESDWSADQVRVHLRKEFNFPFVSSPGFFRYIRGTWPEEYEKGIARG